MDPILRMADLSCVEVMLVGSSIVRIKGTLLAAAAFSNMPMLLSSRTVRLRSRKTSLGSTVSETSVVGTLMPSVMRMKRIRGSSGRAAKARRKAISYGMAATPCGGRLTYGQLEQEGGAARRVVAGSKDDWDGVDFARCAGGGRNVKSGGTVAAESRSQGRHSFQ